MIAQQYRLQIKRRLYFLCLLFYSTLVLLFFFFFFNSQTAINIVCLSRTIDSYWITNVYASYITLSEHKVDKYKQYPFVLCQPVTMGHKSVLSVYLTSQRFYSSVILFYFIYRRLRETRGVSERRPLQQAPRHIKQFRTIIKKNNSGQRCTLFATTALEGGEWAWCLVSDDKSILLCRSGKPVANFSPSHAIDMARFPNRTTLTTVRGNVSDRYKIIEKL